MSDSTTADSLTDQQLEAIARSGPTIEALDAAINTQRAALFQVLGIIRMAAQTIREPGYKRAETDAWEALDGAAGLLCRVLDRLETTETMIAAEVRHGDY